MKSGNVPESIESNFKSPTIMKISKLLTLLALCINLIPSCAPLTIAVHRSGNGGPPIAMYPPQRPLYGEHCDRYGYNNGGSYYGPRYNQPEGMGQTLYHGSQARHVYGSGWQTYADGTIIKVP